MNIKYEADKFKQMIEEKEIMNEDNKEIINEMIDTIYKLENEILILKYQKEIIEQESENMLKEFYTNLDGWKRNINNSDYLKFL